MRLLFRCHIQSRFGELITLSLVIFFVYGPSECVTQMMDARNVSLHSKLEREYMQSVRTRTRLEYGNVLAAHASPRNTSDCHSMLCIHMISVPLHGLIFRRKSVATSPKQSTCCLQCRSELTLKCLKNGQQHCNLCSCVLPSERPDIRRSNRLSVNYR